MAPGLYPLSGDSTRYALCKASSMGHMLMLHERRFCEKLGLENARLNKVNCSFTIDHAKAHVSVYYTYVHSFILLFI